MVAVLAVGGEQGLGFDRVAEAGAGAVRFDHVDVGRREPALASAWRMTRCCEGPLGAVRPLEAPSELTARAAHDRQYRVTVAAGVGQPLEHSRPTPSAQLMPSAASANGLAPAVGRQPALPAEVDERAGRGHHGHATGQRERAFAADAAPARQGGSRPATTSTPCPR